MSAQDPTQDPNFGMIGTSQPQDPSVLAQALQSQSYPLPLTQQPSQQTSQEQDVSALMPHVDLTQQLQQMGHAERDLRRKEYLTHALGDLVFSLGQGLTAAAQTPRTGDANAAGAGAALQAPQVLQQIKNQQMLQQNQQLTERIRAQAAAQNAQTMEQYRQMQEQQVPVTDPTTGMPILDSTSGQPMMTDRKTAAMIAARFGTTAMQQAGANNRADIRKEIAQMLNTTKGLQEGWKVSFGDDGKATYEPLPYDQLTPQMKAKIDYEKAGTELREAQKDFEKSKNDPNSPAFKAAMARLDAATGNLQLRQQEFNANYLGTFNGQPLPGGPSTDTGAPMGLKTAQALGGQAPQQIKTQTAAALTTKDMIDIVKGLVAKKPYLIGPAAGRAAEAAQGIGTSFGMQDPQDEKDAATLSGHLGYLFANEIRAAFPNRPPREIIDMLKQKSAQMKDDPSMLEGFLKSAENNANVALSTGAKFNIPQAKQAIKSTDAVVKPPQAGAMLTPNVAQQYLSAAKGDRAKARSMAINDGWTIPKIQ